MITILLSVLLVAAAIAAFTFGQKARRIKEEKKENERRLEDLLVVDKIKNDFLSIAQHQLRTPLSGAKWALEMLRKDDTIPLQSQALIDQTIERINTSISIVNEMLTTAEATDSAKLKMESVDIAGMITGIIAELNFNIINKEVSLNYFGPESILIQADRSKIKAALQNIIDNAIIYSPKGKVDVLLEDGENAVRFIVNDTGIGIADEDKPFIFERMHRGKNALRLEPSESGVGLALSKKIIDLHKGSISVESELNKGTTVTVILPKTK